MKKRKWTKRDKKVVRVAVQTKLTEVDILRERRVIEYILKIIEKYYKLDPDFVISKSRKRELVFGRQVAMYLMFRYTSCSLNRIGEVFNGKDHATVLHGKRTVANLMETEKKVKSEIEELEKIVELNLKVIEDDIDLSKDFYYVNFNNYESLMISGTKGMILTGFTDEELSKIKELFPEIIEQRTHQNTGLYILEKKHENTN